MQAIIKQVTSAKRVIRYHEQKIEKGVARMIMASGFLREPGELSPEHILARFNPLLNSNEKAHKKVFHTSVGFDPNDEPKLSDTALQEISRRFMQGIGFGEQPYLVYRHFDTGVPHVHIVCPIIDRDGERLMLPNVREGSPFREKLRQIDDIFGLAHQKTNKIEKEIDFTDSRNLPRKVMARDKGILPNMARAIKYVKDHYAYTSLSEFNGVLREYNIQANPVRSVLKEHKHRGLVYVRLNEAGKEIHSFIPSSYFLCKPTLPNLERKFLENKSKRERHKAYLQSTLGHLTQNSFSSLDDLFKELARERIATIIRHDSDDKVVGFTYVNHEDRCVFHDEDLDAEFSARTLLQRFGPKNALEMIAKKARDEKDRAMSLDRSRSTSNKVAAQKLTPADELRPGSPLANLIKYQREDKRKLIREKAQHRDHSPYPSMED